MKTSHHSAVLSVPHIHEPPDEDLVQWLKEKKFDDEAIDIVSIM